MDRFTSKSIGRLALLAGTAVVLAILTLVLFFVGLFQDISALASLGSVNDTLNAIFSLLSAVLASVLYPVLRRFVPCFHRRFLERHWHRTPVQVLLRCARNTGTVRQCGVTVPGCL